MTRKTRTLIALGLVAAAGAGLVAMARAQPAVGQIAGGLMEPPAPAPIDYSSELEARERRASNPNCPWPEGRPAYVGRIEYALRCG